MIDKALLKILDNRETFEKYYPLIKPSMVTSETMTVLMDMELWYKDNERIDWPSFSTWFNTVRHPGLSVDQHEFYHKLFENLDASPTTYTESRVSEALVERETFSRVAERALDIAEGAGNYSPDEVSEILEEYNKKRDLLGDLLGHEVSSELSDIVTALGGGTGYEWPIEELNVSAGPINNDLVLLGARPDSGKTSFLAHCTQHWVHQAPDDRCILWLCNEESGIRVRARIMSACIKRSTASILDSPTAAYEEYRDFLKGDLNKIKIFHNPDMTIRDIQQYCKALNPAVIVVDQLRHVRGYERRVASDVERLKLLYRSARSLATEYGPVVTVHQARGDAEGEMYPRMNQLEGCQTEIQGELDLQLMLGRTYDSSYDPNARGLAIVKNKLPGGPRTDPAKRNWNWELVFNPDTCEFYGVL